MVFILKITGLIDDYLSKEVIQSYQNSKTRWFKEGILNYGMHFREHSLDPNGLISPSLDVKL